MQLALLAHRVLRDHRGKQARKVLKENKVCRANKVPLDLLDLLARQVQRVPKVPKAPKVLQVRQALKDHKARLATTEYLRPSLLRPSRVVRR